MHAHDYLESMHTIKVTRLVRDAAQYAFCDFNFILKFYDGGFQTASALRQEWILQEVIEELKLKAEP